MTIAPNTFSLRVGLLLTFTTFRFPFAYVLPFLLGMTLWAPAARASVDEDVQLDIQRIRADALVSTGRGSGISGNAFLDQVAFRDQIEGQKAPEFTFSASAPFFYNSNAESTPSNSTRTLEVNPDIRLAWSRKEFQDKVAISAFIDAGSDRFVHSKNADSDSLTGQLRAQYFSDLDEDQSLAPFISYSPASGFSPTFSGRTSTAHDISLGFDKMCNFGDDWKQFHGPNTLDRAYGQSDSRGTLHGGSWIRHQISTF